MSGRNLQRTHVLPYSDVSTYHLLWSDVVLIESNALGYTLETVDERADAPQQPEVGEPSLAGPRRSRTRKTAKRRGEKVSREEDGREEVAKSAKPKASGEDAKKPAARSARRREVSNELTSSHHRPPDRHRADARRRIRSAASTRSASHSDATKTQIRNASSSSSA